MVNKEKKNSSMNKSLILGIILISSLIIFFTWYFSNHSMLSSEKTEHITIGGPISDASTLIFTAEDRRFFDDVGLNVTLKEYSSGLTAIDALLNKEIDVAGTAEYPLVVRVLGDNQMRIIGCFDRIYNEYLVVQTNRGIQNISDLKGKTVGLPRGTICEFYLGRFLNLHGLSIEDVTLVNLNPVEAVTAFGDTADAVVVWEPFVSQINEQNVNETIQWLVHNDQATYAVLICRTDWIQDHSDLIRQILDSLKNAEEYIVENPTDAKTVLKERYNYTDSYVERIWPEHQFSLFLDQSLILAMEDEARWMISNNLTNKTIVPIFLDYIYSNALQIIKPEAVNIIQ